MRVEKIIENHFQDDDPYRMPRSGVILVRVDDGSTKDGSTKGGVRLRRWIDLPDHFLPPQNGSQIKKQF